MSIYVKNDIYELRLGKMQYELSTIPTNSIDCIVTDPPYELNFMNKGWDNSGVAFQVDTWQRCLRVLKPGGYLLSFGGSRTFHRIACAIEDAGFEIRDTIMWLYGCYSSDTQVLTETGWKYFYELNRTEKILQWDKNTNKLTWIKPLNYFEYEIEDEMCLFENHHISQLVTKNHKVACQIKLRRKQFSEYQLIEASNIKPSYILNFPMAGELDGEIIEEDAYIIGWWITDAYKHNDGKACMFTQSKPKTLQKLRNWLDSHNIKYNEYVKHNNNPNHRDEHIFYVTGELSNKLLTNYPDRELNWDVLKWDINSRMALLEGLMDGDGSYRDGEYSKTFWSQKQERLDIVQALCISLNYRAYIGNKGCVNFNIKHNSTQTQTRHHKPNIFYKGKVYCLETETGAFVVRRNGKAFISGNSGFPKSMNISKSIEAKLTTGSANTQEFKNLQVDKVPAGSWGLNANVAEQGARPVNYNLDGHLRTTNVEYTTEEAKQWEGWGTALKPSFEPIIVARKPFKGSLVDNVIKYGVGGINIDECRVDFVSQEDYKITANKNQHEKFGTQPLTNNNVYGDYSMIQPKNYSTIGRFPANTILTYDDTDFDEVCGSMPYTKSSGGVSTMQDFRDVGKKSKESIGINKLSFGQVSNSKRKETDYSYPIDEGSAARYFYCAKASRKDRDDGLEKFDVVQTGELQGGRTEGSAGSLRVRNDGTIGVNPYAGNGAPKKNTHPCVKPTELTQYLIKLVAPKGAIILDPFMGSGSTGKAAMIENTERNANYKFIGIEMTPEYLPIAHARIQFGLNWVPEIIEDNSDSILPKTQSKPKLHKLF